MVPFRHILVPLDGSELAEKALAPASQIARSMARAGDEAVCLVLLRAVAPFALIAADPMLYDEMARMGIDEAQAYLNRIAASLSVGEASVETHAVAGSPADTIVHFAEENGVDLIMMSSHGRTGSSRWVYGSVAEKVLHHAPCAALIIRAHVAVELFQNRKMLVTVDGSPLSERVLEPALALARAVQSEVLLLRIVLQHEPLPETIVSGGDRAEAALSAIAAQERADAETYLQRIFSTHANQHLFFDVQTAEGDIAETIVSYADAHHVDLIVMSSHGRSGIGRWLHGSVAEKVLRGANCATLIYRVAEK